MSDPAACIVASVVSGFLLHLLCEQVRHSRVSLHAAVLKPLVQWCMDQPFCQAVPILQWSGSVCQQCKKKRVTGLLQKSFHSSSCSPLFLRVSRAAGSMDKSFALAALREKLPRSKLWSIVRNELLWYPMMCKDDFQMLDDFSRSFLCRASKNHC